MSAAIQQRRPRRRCIEIGRLVALSILATGAPVRAAETPVARHIIVVGVNRSADTGVPALRFADDDAARYAEVLESGATNLILLSAFDPETQRRHPNMVERTRPPTRAALIAAAQESFDAIRKSHDRGEDADLLFIYVGHGGVDEHGEGYVSLLDGRLTRTALFEQVIGPSPARFNHVIVDACSAYHLLHRGPDAVRAVRAFLSRSTLADYPNTGALLATSRDRATHEWTRIGGGVFSYEILSALAGAADVDRDGAVQYREIGAFIEAANEGIRDRRARIDLYLRPPQLMVKRPLWTTARGDEGASLLLAARDVGHYAISDARGVAVAELHKSGEQPLELILAGAAPFTVSQGDADRITSDAPRGTLRLTDLRPVPRTLRERSAIAAALERGLFSVPFGKSYVRGYGARLQRDLEADDEVVVMSAAPEGDGVPTWISLGALGGGALLGVASMAALGVGVYELISLDQGKGEMTAFEAESREEWANVAFWGGGLTGALAIGALVAGAALLDAP